MAVDATNTDESSATTDRVSPLHRANATAARYRETGAFR